jgi:choloylglycine hydrolase
MRLNSISTYLRLSVCAGLISFLVADQARACTSLVLDGTDNGHVYARTMEFGIPLKSAILKTPRGYAFQGVGIDGVAGSGKNWVSKYAVIGANAFGMPLYVDGINEVGLAGGLLNAPNTAQYQSPTQAQSSNSIAPQQLLLYALTNFATVAEVKAALPAMFVNSSPLKEWGGVAKSRMTLHDASGASLVVEYVNGALVMTDNTIGTMTNDPVFSWHLQNIGNYTNLSGTDKKPMTVDGKTFYAASSGNGLHGMPGSFLSPDRFIRASLFVLNTPAATTDIQERRAWHIMNNFDIPFGAIHLDSSSGYGGGVNSFEYTEWVVVANMKSKTYNIRSFENPGILSITFSPSDINAKELTSIPLLG